MSGNGREVLYVKLIAAVKDPHRSGGQADELRVFPNAPAHRRMWVEGPVLHIEAIDGPHKGQLVCTPWSNVVWARLKPSAEVAAKKAG